MACYYEVGFIFYTYNKKLPLRSVVALTMELLGEGITVLFQGKGSKLFGGFGEREAGINLDHFHPTFTSFFHTEGLLALCNVNNRLTAIIKVYRPGMSKVQSTDCMPSHTKGCPSKSLHHIPIS